MPETPSRLQRTHRYDHPRRRCGLAGRVARDDTLDIRTLLPAAILLTAALPAAAGAQDRGDSRTDRDEPGIVGVVVDRVTRQPLEGVAVTLEPADEGGDTLRAGPPVLTDSAGRFVLRDLADGRYRIVVERIGYQEITNSIDFRTALGLLIDIEMVPEAVELEALLVVAEARSIYLESSGFYDRRHRGLGRFVTRDEILSRHPFQVSDALRVMPGVRMSASRTVSGQEVVLLRGNCIADVYVDGIRMIPPAPIDALVQPIDVDGVEVYHGSEIPARFRTTSCGAVVIWTHVPNPGSLANPFTWKRALVAASFVGLALFLTR